MTGYLLFSHGSLLCGAGQALDEHEARLSQLLAPEPVEIGYLNYSEPDVETGISRLVERGVSKIVVVPYFLVPGYFVTSSLPKSLEPLHQKYPTIEIIIADSLGVDTRIADTVIEMSKMAREPMLESADVLAVAAAACRGRSDCPLYNTPHCPKAPGSFVAPISEEIQAAPPPVQIGKVALLIMIHGSPKAEANAPMLEVVEQIKARGIFDFIQPGFMECNSPTIAEAIDLCVESGASQIVAVPYFLHLGTHVAEDLPTILKVGQVKHPSVSILMSDYIGLSPRLSEVLRDRARQTA